MPTSQAVVFLKVLLALSHLATLTGRAKAGPRGHPQPWDWQNKNLPLYQTTQPQKLPSQPEFLPGPRNVTVSAGETAYLPCRVKNLIQHYTVSWIRAHDVTVLSVGSLTFSSDQRLSVLEVPYPRLEASDWSLTIHNSSLGDQGVYECQVNTDPKIHSQFHLSVQASPVPGDPGYHDLMVVDQAASDHRAAQSVEGEMSIMGGSVQYVAQGSPVSLECRVLSLSRAPHTLHWNRRGQALTAQQRPGLSLETERLQGLSRVTLYLAHSELTDTGNYTCVSDGATEKTVLLMVTMGYEIPPKGLKEAGFTSSSPAPLHLLSLLLLLSCLHTWLLMQTSRCSVQSTG